MVIYLRPPTYPRWCRLRDAGGPSHYTACGARISASDAVLITSTPGEVCEACRAAEQAALPTPRLETYQDSHTGEPLFRRVDHDTDSVDACATPTSEES